MTQDDHNRFVEDTREWNGLWEFGITYRLPDGQKYFVSVMFTDLRLQDFGEEKLIRDYAIWFAKDMHILEPEIMKGHPPPDVIRIQKRKDIPEYLPVDIRYLGSSPLPSVPYEPLAHLVIPFQVEYRPND